MPTAYLGITLVSGLVLLCPTALAEVIHPAFSKTHRLAVGAFRQDMSAELTAQRGDFEPIGVELTDVGVD